VRIQGLLVEGVATSNLIGILVAFSLAAPEEVLMVSLEQQGTGVFRRKAKLFIFDNLPPREMSSRPP